MNKTTKNPAAVALGKLGAGHPKNYSKEELAKRTARLKGLPRARIPRKLSGSKMLLMATIASCVLAGNVKAGVTVTEQLGDATVTFNGADGAAFLAAKDAAQKQIALEKWFKTLAAQALTPHDPHVRAAYNDWLRHNRWIHDETQRILAVDQLGQGDKTPLAAAYDDAATIRRYLHDSGYNNLSDAQIVKIGDYMKANHIQHVSEIDPIGNIL
jgi:hypothetical protein